MSSTMSNVLPGSPSSQGGASSDSPILNQPASPLSPSRSTPTGHTGVQFSGESVLTPTLGGATVGVVRRKPARRANTAERRATHNAVERQRRETLNGRFLDLAALLPNLVSVRRPSKSAIVNSSIALVHTQRRQRAIAARELRALSSEADALRREVNEWRAAHPNSSIGGAKSGLIEDPVRSADFIALIELEDVSPDEMEMNEAERIAYEMRGGDSGMMFGDDPEGEDLNDEEFSDGQRAQPTLLTTVSVQGTQASRPRGQSVVGRNHQQSSQNPQGASLPHPLIPSQYHMQHQQLAQQQLLAQHPQQLGFPSSFLPPTFDAIAAAAAAGFPSSAPLVEADAAKLAAWNAHLYSALAAQQQQQQQNQQQQQWAAAMQFQTPPNSAHGAPGIFGAGQQQQQQQQQQHQQAFLAHFQRATNIQNLFHPSGLPNKEEEDADGSGSSPQSKSFGAASSYNSDAPISSMSPGGAGNIPSPTSTTSTTPSLSLSLSGLSSAGSVASSLPASMTSPIHLNLGSDPFSGFPYGSAPAASSWASSRSPTGTPGIGLAHHPQPVSVGGGGGGHASYAMMSMFI